jgi:putative FmdB family regulatory protein
VPTYQYACTACGHQLEAVQSFADEPLTECPSCQGRLRKLFNSVGIVFKGSGFYRTDSRSTSSESSGGNGAAAKPAAGGDSSTNGGSTGSSSGSGSNGSASKETASSAKASAASSAA